MNDNAKVQLARLDDIERRGRDIPVREHLGIHACGINAYRPGEDGTLIGEHDGAGSGQEELYIVLDGKASPRKRRPAVRRGALRLGGRGHRRLGRRDAHQLSPADR